MVLGARTTAALVVIALLTAAVPVQGQSPALPGLGMDQGSVKGLQDAGAPPVYGSYWVGHWMAVHGWGGLDNALASAKATGVTPVIYWYYWGDSITPSCVENGCDGKSMAAWVSMTDTLASKVRQHMGGTPVIIVLENEFNKGGVTDAWYAPKFDAYLEARAKTLKGVPGVHVSLGYGSWGEDAWGRFPRAIAASDSIGFQIMRASTRDSEASYRGSDDKIASVLNHIKSISGKSAFLYDVALSSYPDATYRTIQAETLASILDRRAEYAQDGLVGIVYRELRDNPSMGTHNYFGIAEQYWGFRDTGNNPKPAWDVWMKANNGGTAPLPPPPPPATPLPASFEAETMSPSTGGRNNEPAASGGATWNLWTNGNLRQDVSSEGGAFRVSVVARGAPAAGIDPNMELRVNGVTKATWTVPAGLRAYAADVELPRGAATLAVHFTNDALVNGEDRNLFVDVVRVAAPAVNQPPAARLSANMGDLTLSADAGASSDPEGAALAYEWDFGDGARGAGVKATHTYAGAGSYVVTLRVSDGAATSTATATVTARAPNRAPAASFEVSGSHLSWGFDARGSTDADGDALTYQWSFGDGATATGATATHAYAVAGTYAVTLTVGDGKASATSTRSVSATHPNRAPSAAFAVTGADLSWSFDAGGSADADGDALTYAWDMGEGTRLTGVRVSHAYATAGERTVTLTVGDGQASSTATRVVTARMPNRAPVASFAVTGADLGYSFDATASADADGDALTYRWSFGDGATATGPTASRVYARGGEYVVTLTVSDGKTSSTASKTVTAREPNRAPVASIRATGGGLDWTLDASGSADADGDALQHLWTLPDGSTVSGPTLRRTWTAGDHVVRIQVVDGRGGSAQAQHVVEARAAGATRSMEAESFATREVGASFRDSTASGGQGWLVWSNGALRQPFTPGGGAWQVQVVAKGDQANGAPMMELRADGVVVARWSVSATSWTTYAANVAFQPGETRTLSVHFTNDHRTATMDRNLRVDVVRLAQPTLAVEGEAFQAKDNGVAFRDASASGGDAWLLWANGAMRHAVDPGSGAWRVEVVAKGDPAAGWPIMELRADGAPVARWSVATSQWQTYAADVSFGSAPRTLSVHFLNDHLGSEGDRNLRVDVVRLSPQ